MTIYDYGFFEGEITMEERVLNALADILYDMICYEGFDVNHVERALVMHVDDNIESEKAWKLFEALDVIRLQKRLEKKVRKLCEGEAKKLFRRKKDVIMRILGIKSE